MPPVKRRKQVWRPRFVASPAAPSTPFVAQALGWEAAQDNPGVGAVTLTVAAGSSLVVFVQDICLNGTPSGSGPPYSFTLTDSQGGSYTNHGYIGTAAQDAVTVLTRTNISSGSLTVTVTYTTNQWHGLAVAEVRNAGTSPTITLLGGNENVNPTPAAADAITTLTAALGSTPALLVALGFNVSAVTTSDAYPAAGTGFTSNLTCWNWGGVENSTFFPNAQLESKYLASPGTVGATFTARNPGPSTEAFVSIGVAFQ